MSPIQKPPIQGTLADRVRWLIDQRDGGKVLAAANRIGVKNMTLTRIADGTTPSPRARMLQQIAEGYGTTVDWLLTGQGQAPSLEKQEPALWEWRLLVNSLQLPPSAHEALNQLPNAMSNGTQLLGYDAGVSDTRAMQAGVAWHLRDLEVWRLWLREMIRDLGREHVATWCVKREADIRARFTRQPT